MRLKYVILLLTLFQLVSIYNYSTAQLLNLKFNHLNADNGLPMGNCEYGMTDSYGYIWFRSENSLVKYDGFESKIYKLNTDSTLSSTGFVKSGGNMLEDKNGNIWFNVINAIGCYKRNADSLYYYQLAFQTNNIGQSEAELIKWISDSVFIAKYKSINFSFNIKSHRPLILNQKIFNALRYNSIKSDSKISIFVNDNQKGFSIEFFNTYDSTITLRNYFKAEDNQLPALNVNFIKAETDSVLWFTSGSNLFRFSISQNNFQKFFVSSSNSALRFNHLELFENYFFIGSDSGLFVFDKSKKKFVQHYLHNDSDPFSISHNIISPLSIDASGNIFLEANFRGIDVANYYKSKFKYILNRADAEKYNTDAFVRCMVEDDSSNTWLGTMNGGVVVLNKDDEVIKVFKNNAKERSTIPVNGIEYMMKDHLDRIWIVTPSGLAYFDADKKFKRIQFENSTNEYFNRFNFLLETRSHRFIVTKYGQGIFEMRETKSGFVFDTICTNCGIRYLNLYEDKIGRIWMGDDETITLLTLSKNSKYYFEKAIRVNAITKWFHEDDDGKHIWITTSDGLLKMDMQNFSSIKYTVADGLPDNYLYSFVDDDKCDFWLSTNRGLSKFTHGAGRDTFRNYTVADGLQGNEFNTYSFLKKSNGEIWFGGINGINIITPLTYLESKVKPYVHISNMMLNDEPVKFDSIADEKRQYQFIYDDNTFSFSFSATDLMDARKCKLQYKLKGVDDVWLNTSNPGFARYTNLHEGNYVFVIRASNSDGVWSNDVRNIYIKILPPWYRTMWFYVLTTIVVTSTLYLLFRFRIRQVQERENLKIQTILETQKEERKRISRELHDDLGAGLSTILFLTEIAKTQTTEVSSREQLGIISDISNDLVDSMKQIVWTMNAENNTIESLILYLKKYVNDYLDTNNILLQLNIQEEIPNRIISGDMRRNIFLVVKECLHNVAKHAKATTVDLQIEVADKVKIILHDNGIGFDTNKINELGNGLKNMRRRMEVCNGTFEIENRMGTTIILMF